MPSRTAWWQPADIIEVTGPGTHATTRWCSAAVRAVLSEPDLQPGLHDDGALGHRGDHPVALQEPWPGRGRARRDLAHHGADLADPVDQPRVCGGVGPVHPTGEHGQGDRPRGQRSPVRGRVDAEGGAGDHGEAALAEAGRHLGRHHLAVRRGAAGADHGHRPRRRPRPGPRRRAPTGRRAGSRGRPARAATRSSPGQTTRAPSARGHVDVPLGVQVLEPGQEPGEARVRCRSPRRRAPAPARARRPAVTPSRHRARRSGSTPPGRAAVVGRHRRAASPVMLPAPPLPAPPRQRPPRLPRPPRRSCRHRGACPQGERQAHVRPGRGAAAVEVGARSSASAQHPVVAAQRQLRRGRAPGRGRRSPPAASRKTPRRRTAPGTWR